MICINSSIQSFVWHWRMLQLQYITVASRLWQQHLVSLISYPLALLFASPYLLYPLISCLQTPFLLVRASPSRAFERLPCSYSFPSRDLPVHLRFLPRRLLLCQMSENNLLRFVPWFAFLQRWAAGEQTSKSFQERFVWLFLVILQCRPPPVFSRLLSLAHHELQSTYQISLWQPSQRPIPAGKIKF